MMRSPSGDRKRKNHHISLSARYTKNFAPIGRSCQHWATVKVWDVGQIVRRGKAQVVFTRCAKSAIESITGYGIILMSG
jgi:hypothetical protein